MWSFDRIDSLTQDALTGRWIARVVFTKGGTEESFFLKFATEPSTQDVINQANAKSALMNAPKYWSLKLVISNGEDQREVNFKIKDDITPVRILTLLNRLQNAIGSEANS